MKKHAVHETATSEAKDPDYIRIGPSFPVEVSESGPAGGHRWDGMLHRPDRPRPTAKATRLMASRTRTLRPARPGEVIHALPLEDCAPPIEVGL